jgi:hypothetical protein
MLRCGAAIARPFRVVAEVNASLAEVGRAVLKLSNFPGGTRRTPRRDAPEESGQVRLKKAFPCGAFDE